MTSATSRGASFLISAIDLVSPSHTKYYRAPPPDHQITPTMPPNKRAESSYVSRDGRIPALKVRVGSFRWQLQRSTVTHRGGVRSGGRK